MFVCVCVQTPNNCTPKMLEVILLSLSRQELKAIFLFNHLGDEDADEVAPGTETAPGTESAMTTHVSCKTSKIILKAYNPSIL